MISAFIVLDRRPAESTLGWLLVITLLPGVGIICFAIFGIRWQRVKLMRYRPEDVFGERLKRVLEEQRTLIKEQLRKSNEKESDIFKNINLLNCSNNAVVTTENQYALYYDGQSFFDKLLKDIKNAKQTIYMEFFIWRSDELGERIKEALVKKANEGVNVKLIFDSFGSFCRISYKYRKELKAANIEYKYFLDVFQPISGITRFNYRNHRKVIVIDNCISYTGGMNVGIEYITGGKRFDSWRDTQIRFIGETSELLQNLFLTDWINSGGKEVPNNTTLPKCEIDLNKLPVQVAVSGPDSSWNAIKLTLFNLIANANESIYIQSPYLIPDQGIIEALQAAALSGVEVHFMMTGVPDKRIAFWAAETYIDDLLKAGIHVYQYTAGFFHSKTAIIDERICSVGTTNLDVRSFKLNYEVNTIIYNRDICQELLKSFQRDTKKCIKRNLESTEKKNILVAFRDSFCRLLSPIM